MINVYDLGKPKSVASVIYLAVANNYTVIQHVKQILDDFVVSAVSKLAPENTVQNLKCYFCQRLRSPFFGHSFISPLSITLEAIQQSISLNPMIKLNEQNDEVSVICKRRCMTTYGRQKLSTRANQWFSSFQR